MTPVLYCLCLQGYLGSVESGKAYDACELLSTYSGPKIPILVDQGTADGFLKNQLKTENLAKAAGEAKYPVTIRYFKDNFEILKLTLLSFHMKDIECAILI